MSIFHGIIASCYIFKFSVGLFIDLTVKAFPEIGYQSFLVYRLSSLHLFRSTYHKSTPESIAKSQEERES